MQIIVEVNNAKKLDLLIELLRSVEFVKNIRLADAPTPAVSPKNPQSFFTRFYGSLNTGTNPDEIDQKLNALREEWERDIF
ncbi:MAG TPA: hypothetical protein PK228_07190 [Saprospiraceae bacterium]|nr:hypothetical protein [Saprospiraceae bacterium]